MKPDRVTAAIKAQQKAAGIKKYPTTDEINRNTLLLLYRMRRGISAQIAQLRKELQA